MTLFLNLNLRIYALIVLCMLTLASPVSWADSTSGEAVDPRLSKIVNIVKDRADSQNDYALRQLGSQTETDMAAQRRLAFVERMQTAIFTDSPEKIREAVREFEAIDTPNNQPSLARVSKMFETYAASLEALESPEDRAETLLSFTEEGSWIEKYFAFRVLTELKLTNGDRQGALEAAENALALIPDIRDGEGWRDLRTSYTQYARAEVTSALAQLHNRQGNTELAIETTLEFLDLTKDTPNHRGAVDLINNLIFSHLLSRESEAVIYLGENLVEIEQQASSDVPGLSQLRIAQAMNTVGRFKEALSYADQSISKVENEAVERQAQIVKAISLAGLGKKSQARRIAKAAGAELDRDHLLYSEMRRENLYLGFLLALNDDNVLAQRLYNRQVDVTAQKFLQGNSRDTTSMLATLENNRERQAERESAAQREAALLEVTIQKQRKLNRALMVLIGLLVVAFTALFAFLKFRERTMRALAIKTEEAASADKLKTEFLGLISHELRTPLNGIIGFSDLLTQTHSDPNVRKKTSVILQSGHELLAVVEAMTDMARIDAGRMDVLPEETHIPDLVLPLIEEAETKAGAKNIAFTAFIDPALDRHTVDGARLAQSIRTLLSNAISFTEEGRVHLHITAKKDATESVVGLQATVADTGVGMTDIVQSRLFTPFMQADTSLKRSHMGTGLSLAIAKALVELMGGTLDVVSRTGRGSEFTINVPLEPVVEDIDPTVEAETAVDVIEADPVEIDSVLPPPVIDLMEPRVAGQSAPLHMPPVQQDTSANLEGLRVLIVDDIACNRDVVREMLESEGCICFEASDGEEALKALHTGPVDAVIMDIHMSRMDGVEATRSIRDSHAPFADLPIIALTADNAATTNAACMAAGADIFLTKPVLAGELRGALEFLQTGTSRRALSRSS